MVELYENQLMANAYQSSKGNQLKWTDGSVWYKADASGYEGLSEFIAAQMLKHSNLSAEEFVDYQCEIIKYKSALQRGCRCDNFLKPGESLITLERLMKTTMNQSLHRLIYETDTVEGRFELLVRLVEKVTGLQDFAKYMTKVFTIDAFCVNEDRHTHNLAVIRKASGAYRLCPIFDQGASLLADIRMDYPMGGDIYQYLDCVKSKTICGDFDEQLDVAENVTGQQVKFTFSKTDVEEWLTEAKNYYEEAIIDRVRRIVYERMRKYQYLF